MPSFPMLEPEPSNKHFSERTDENGERATTLAFGCPYKSTPRSIYSRKPSELRKDNGSPVSAPGTFPPFLPSFSSGRRYHSSKLFRPRLLGSLPAAAVTQKYSPQNGQSDTILIQPQSCVVQAEPYVSVVQSQETLLCGPHEGSSWVYYSVEQQDPNITSLSFLS